MVIEPQYLMTLTCFTYNPIEEVSEKGYLGTFTNTVYLSLFSSATQDYFEENMAGTEAVISNEVFEVQYKSGETVTINNPVYEPFKIMFFEGYLWLADHSVDGKVLMSVNQFKIKD